MKMYLRAGFFTLTDFFFFKIFTHQMFHITLQVFSFFLFSQGGYSFQIIFRGLSFQMGR